MISSQMEGLWGMGSGVKDVKAKSVVVDEKLLREALDECNLNCLRMSLYQQTADPDLRKMKIVPHNRRGTPFLNYLVDSSHHDELKEKAFRYLSSGDLEPAPAPDRNAALELMDMFQGGHNLDPSASGYGYEELAFEEFPREAKWKGEIPKDRLKNFKVTVIGSGFSGIMAAIQLDRLGIECRVLERQSGIGGTWELNDYPEARVDITTFLYQYKFVKKYPWKSYFATRDELKEYVDYVVDEYGIRDKIELSTKLLSAHWDNATKEWVLEIEGPDGSTETHLSNVVITACGLFSTPHLPDIPGIRDYKGKMFHTTAWDHDYDYTGKRIALIGTGSTGSQMAPDLARRGERLTIYQRTPNWVTPIRGYHDTVSPGVRWLLDNMPYYANWFAYNAHVAQLQNQAFHPIDPEWQAKGGHINEKNDQLRSGLTAYIRNKVGDRDDLFEKLVPDYAPLARRLVVDNGWYDTLLKDNVELETGGIQKFTEDGIISNDGVERKFDLIVLGAGFKVSQYLWPVEYVGRDGATLEDLWEKDGARAHLTMTMPGFPNFFMLYGPNAGTRSGSFHSWIEILVRYVGNVITEMVAQGASQVELKREAYCAYNDELDEEMSKMLWESEKGGGGYYVNEFGRSGVNMPWTLADFYARVKEPNIDDFDLS